MLSNIDAVCKLTSALSHIKYQKGQHCGQTESSLIYSMRESASVAESGVRVKERCPQQPRHFSLFLTSNFAISLPAACQVRISPLCQPSCPFAGLKVRERWLWAKVLLYWKSRRSLELKKWNANRQTLEWYFNRRLLLHSSRCLILILELRAKISYYFVISCSFPSLQNAISSSRS